MVNFDTIIIGGGAAGLMCAIEAGKRGRKAALIELAGSLGKKILISGGGRCNFTNIYCKPSNYISENPHFCKSALSRFTPSHFIELVEKYNISYHEKTLGQLFCDGSSRQIVGLLKNECDENNVTIYLDTKVNRIYKESQYLVNTQNGVLSAETLVIATGGLSIPKMGATDFGHRVAKQFNHSLVQCRPGLVPLTMTEKDLKTYSQLSGIAFPTVASCGEIEFRESMLLTHRGISGPAVLQISSYWQDGEVLNFKLCPDIEWHEYLIKLKKDGDRSELKTILSELLPRKFVEVLILQIGQSLPIIQYSDKEILRISNMLSKWSLTPSGTEGFSKAEVTIGGVSTENLSSKTMESKLESGLFFIGEVVDVTGHLGGFNFQWAWASGYAAGQEC